GWFGLLSMIPLTVTITFIYGLIGWIGKDYDMPVAILSAMTLGLSVDFAIHFLERSREVFKRAGNWKATSEGMFNEPAKAISRNAIVIALGFTPLLLAPLVPYRTVGFFLAMIMLLSWLATLLILPALIRKLEKRMFKPAADTAEPIETK
ncbi:MAG TPA: MMPL family transporter, partial [bacterium]|nr:MMPL family transporter [bacterium]